MSLHIAKNLRLADTAVTQTFGIIAQRRKGKTYTANVMAEEMVASGIPWVALDPTGAWWGLRSSTNGKSAGLPVYVFGGDHGDLPLERTAGKMIADLVVEYPGWYILDFSHLESKEAERQVATDFAERFYRRKGSNKTPVHLFVDEADMFAPQRTPSGDQRMLGAFEALVRRGGIRGIGTTLITQRAAVLNKNVLEQIDVLIALRTVGPNDRKAIAGYVEANGTSEQQAALMGSLASLGLGEAWVWEPGADLFERVRIRQRKTFNSSATPDASMPKVVKLAKVDLERISVQMADTIQRAEADDPKILRRHIIDLERQLKNQKPAETKIEIKEVPVVTDELLKQLQIIVDELQKHVADFQRAIKKVIPGSSPLQHRTEQAFASPKEAGSQGFLNIEPINFDTKMYDTSRPKIKGGARRMLEVLGTRYPMTFTRSQLATLSKMSPRSGTFGTYMSLLRSNGLIAQEDHTISLTAEGLAYLGDTPLKSQTTDEVLDMWRNNLTGGAKRMFNTLVNFYPASISREELGQEADISPTSGTFGTYISMLRGNGLIMVEGREIRASDNLFVGAAK